MFKILSTMPHVMFGIWGVVAAVWVLVEAINASEKNVKRLKIASRLSAVFIWLAGIFGGWWYVVHYASDKIAIKEGQWAWAHSIFMEVKEHAFFFLLMLGMMLPIFIAKNNLAENKGAKRIVITVAILIIVVGFGMELFGSIITKGVKVGLIGGV